MSGLINLRAAIWCLSIAAILLIGMLWTSEHFHHINARYRPIIGCLASQAICITLLILIRAILLSAAAEEKKREDLMDQTAGGRGYCYFTIVNNGPPWPLDVMNPGKVALLDVNVYLMEMPSPQDTPREKLRKLNSRLHLTLGTVTPGGVILNTFISPPQSIEMNIVTRRDRFIERLWIAPSKKNPIFLDEKVEIYHWGDMMLLYTCCPEIVHHSWPN